VAPVPDECSFVLVPASVAQMGSPEFERTPMRCGAATPAGFGCGPIHCGTGMAISKIEIHDLRPIRIDADLLLILVRIHAGEPLILKGLSLPVSQRDTASSLTPKTIQKHVGNMWVLGGEFIRGLHNDLL